MRILLVEDDMAIADHIVKGFQELGYVVDHAATGIEGQAFALNGEYDAAVLDLMLPGINGLGILAEMRGKGIDTPVIILSARQSVDDKVLGLQAGGDDYLTKPFSFSELHARVQALMRRASKAPANTLLQVGDLQMNRFTREVTRAGQQIVLQAREYALLEYLMSHPGRVVTKTMILEHVWDYSFSPQTNVVEVLMHRSGGRLISLLTLSLFEPYGESGMLSAATFRQTYHKFLSLRLLAGYFALFVLSSVMLFVSCLWLLHKHTMELQRGVIIASFQAYEAEYRAQGADGLRRLLVHSHPANRVKNYFVKWVDSAGNIQWLTIPEEFESQAGLVFAVSPATEEGNWQFIDLPTASDVDVYGKTFAGGETLYLGWATGEQEGLVEAQRDMLALVLAGMLLLGLGGGVFFAYRVLKPVRELAATVQTVAAGDMSMRVPTVQAQGELAQLAELFNHMLHRIEVLVVTMRDALNNVSHDLRTPLARMKAKIERTLVQQGSEAEQREALMDCAEEIERIDQLITMLMDVAEAETGQMRLSVEPLEAVSVLGEASILYEFVAESRSQTLVVDAENVSFVADRLRVVQVMANLVDNACKYAPEGGTIVLTAYSEPTCIVLGVHDSGPGIPEEERERVFDKLYRLDKSRTTKGLGLGLSLVQAVAAAHGGNAFVDSSHLGGSFFAIRLPVA